MTTAEAADGSTSRGRLRSLVKVVVYKEYVLLKRYPVNTISEIVAFLIIFAAIVFLGRAVAGQALSDSLGGIIVGFFLWILAMGSFGTLSQDIITREAQWGTFERLYISPHGFLTVITVMVVVNLVFSFLLATILLVGEMAIAGRWLAIRPLTIVPLLTLTLLPAFGMGFVFGGLALIYKRIGNLFQIVNFVFIGLLAAPVDTYEWLKVLPISQGSYLLRTAMQNGVHIWNLPLSELAVLLVNGVVYLLIGVAVFRYSVNRARQQNLMGDY